jgi:hypothetical protein
MVQELRTRAKVTSVQNQFQSVLFKKCPRATECQHYLIVRVDNFF